MLSKDQIKTIMWYRQSGAGIPLCIGMPFLALSERMYSKSGFYFPNDLGIFLKTDSGFSFYHYFDSQKTFEQVQKIFETVDANPQLFETLKQDFYQSAAALEQTGLDLIKTDTKGNSFKKLYEDFLEYSMQFWESSLYIDLLDPFEQEIIEFIFGNQAAGLSKQEVSILFSPDEWSHFQKYQQDLLDAYDICQTQGIESDEVSNACQRLSEKYYWLQNDYETVMWLDQEYFSTTLNLLMETPAEVESIKANLAHVQATRDNKKQLIRSLELSEQVTNRLNFFNWVTTYRDDRKKYNQISNYILIQLIERMAVECSIDIELLKYAMPNELAKIVEKDANVMTELTQRADVGLIVFADRETPLEVVSGTIAREYFELLEATVSGAELRGTVASPGKVTAPVKIILNQNDFAKMEAGDVIVASMTRPEYVPIMKKASAIVTDEGGITCHAAIVSRELNIPCITGTQTATRMLQDGDMVIVNADHGLVKIVSKVD